MVDRGSAAPSYRSALGLNAWLVEEMYEEFVADPSRVSESWREFFADYKRRSRPAEHVEPGVPSGPVHEDAKESTYGPLAISNGSPAVGNGTAVPALSATKPLSSPAAGAEQATPLRGVAARIASNMVDSLKVPTATSVHPVPAKLLDVNRSILNEHLARVSGGKVSFTHLISWAIVRALGKVPALNSSFIEDLDGQGTPGVVRHEHVGLGLAIDLERPDGSRSLLVPVIHGADATDFSGFLIAYEDLIRRARSGKLAVEDFAGATVTITNPGTLGTTQSVPRLLSGQGAIIGVGALGYPPEYEGMDAAQRAALGIGPVVTLTSTYDHRIIQGAESGLFLKRVHELLVGADGFYDEIFRSLGVPMYPLRWRSISPMQTNETPARPELEKQAKVDSLVRTYRVRGHLIAQLDPLADGPPELRDDLDPASYGLSVWDLDRRFYTDGLGGESEVTLGRILQVLRDAYCRTVGIEYMHIQSPDERAWIQEHVEGVETGLSSEEQRHILLRLNAAEAFERFLHSRYVGQKRFGLEGAESTIPFLDALLEDATRAGLSEAVLGMAHRGRLNVLANIVGKSYGEIFAEFEGNLDPETVQGSGDVKYHKGAVGKWVGRDGLSLPVTMASNPSHLEAVDPVVEGMARAKLDHTDGFGEFPVLAILIHGDAAFAGQGVVAETLNLSMLTGYRIGGTVHLIINNQVGFTTPPVDARSTVYATDVAKMVQAPIFHVNGDDPEAVVRVARLALAYREAFHKDVVVDIICYRLHGHNEGDDPSYTQPLLYKKIEAHRSVRKIYTEELVTRGDLTMEEAERALADFQSRLQAALDETRLTPLPTIDASVTRRRPPTDGLRAVPAVPRPVLDALSTRLHVMPDGFTLHPKLVRQFQQRNELYRSGFVDWALAEALSIGSVLVEGFDVRLTGQDTARGTFSQRHAVLVDYETGEAYAPLVGLGADSGNDGSPVPDVTPGRFYVRDSLLSEYAALGFEYGYSVEARDALVCWEAQFGDFANGAQIIIDNFIVAAEEKWGQTSGLVLLLPHGYEGQGPEHSSARLERYLTLAAYDTITVAQPTTAAQYFHLLRAQAHRSARRPLIVMTPKSLLRATTSRSKVDELCSGHFSEVLDDPASIDRAKVRRIVCATGKIAFEAIARRDARVAAGKKPAAIIRVEQLVPWPEEALGEVIDRYPNATELVWLQDEPENMGAWTFVHERLHALVRDRYRLSHVSRDAAGSPATGSFAVHEFELASLLERSVGPAPVVS